MKYILRPYQQDAANKAVSYLLNKEFETEKNKITTGGVLVLPTGSGKSLIISEICRQLKLDHDAKILVIQASKEILIQNYQKYISYGLEASIYSASYNSKEKGDVTFSTIGSVKDSYLKFKDVEYVIIDECHQVKPTDSMYHDFFRMSAYIKCPKKIIGLTASPYRLSIDGYGGAMLKMITRTRPRIFDEILYHIQNSFLIKEKFLMPIIYHDIKKVNRDKLQLNSTGMDYTEKSLRKHYGEIGFKDLIVRASLKLLDEVGRKNLAVFVRYIDDAVEISSKIPNSAVVSSKTPKKERDYIIENFKNGNIRCVCNVGVLAIGFDFPELETVLFARETMSLAIWYQAIGRLSRMAQGKSDAWCIDMGGNHEIFGDINMLKFEYQNNGTHFISSVIDGKYKQLTNVYLSK